MNDPKVLTVPDPIKLPCGCEAGLEYVLTGAMIPANVTAVKQIEPTEQAGWVIVTEKDHSIIPTQASEVHIRCRNCGAYLVDGEGILITEADDLAAWLAAHLAFKPRFDFGEFGLRLTPGVVWHWVEHPDFNPFAYFRRHCEGDWGDIEEADKRENEYSLERNLRLVSRYQNVAGGENIYIITEADRSVTTILLVEEY